MSVKMALAKLCACACGGAVMGGGAMHVAQQPTVQHAKVHKAKSKPKARKHLYAKRSAVKPRRLVKRIRRVGTQYACAAGGMGRMGGATTTTTVTRSAGSRGGGAIATPLPPMGPVDAAYAQSQGGSGYPVVVGGSGGYGGFGGGSRHRYAGGGCDGSSGAHRGVSGFARRRRNLRNNSASCEFPHLRP